MMARKIMLQFKKLKMKTTYTEYYLAGFWI